MTQYVKILDNYFRVLDLKEGDDTRTIITDRPVQLPRGGIFRALIWQAKNQWYRVQWEKENAKEI